MVGELQRDWKVMEGSGQAFKTDTQRIIMKMKILFSYFSLVLNSLKEF